MIRQDFAEGVGPGGKGKGHIDLGKKKESGKKKIQGPPPTVQTKGSEKRSPRSKNRPVIKEFGSPVLDLQYKGDITKKKMCMGKSAKLGPKARGKSSR